MPFSRILKPPCGATFHQVCLTNQKYDINSHDGCFRCKAPSLFATNHKSIVGAQCNPSKKSELDSSKDRIKLLDEGDDDDHDDDDVIILITLFLNKIMCMLISLRQLIDPQYHSSC